MKTKMELEQKIIKITTKIQNEFPELSKYIAEMPGNNSENEEINIKTLEDYYHSLEDILNEYAKTHTASITKNNIETPAYSDLRIYPPSEDIYQQSKKQTDLNPVNISKKKTLNEKVG